MPDEALIALLERARRRLRARRLLRGAVLGLWGGLAAALIIGVVSWFWWPAPFHPAIPGALALLAGLATGLLAGGSGRGLSAPEVAMVLDRALGTGELVITALHAKGGASWADDAVLSRLEARIPELPRQLSRIPVRPPHRSALLPIAALAALALFAWPRPPATAAADDAVAREAERLGERVAALEDGVDLPPDVERAVEDLIDDLSSGDLSEETARERIAEVQDQLDALRDRLQESRDLLKDLEDAAGELAKQAQTRDLADAIAEGDLLKAGQEARELAESMSEASPEERQRVGEALERAGERLAQSQDPGLQQAGQEMARAGRQLQGDPGDPQGGSSDRSDLGDELARQQALAERLKGDEARLERTQELNGALEGSRQRLGGEPGVGRGEGGEGGETPGEAVSDWGTGHTWEDEGVSRPAPTGHRDADRHSDRAAGEELDDFRKLYDPLRAASADGLLTSVDGQIDERGHIDHLPTRVTHGDETATAPLLTLPDGYREAADAALAGERVPPGYREAVKEYFDATR